MTNARRWSSMPICAVCVAILISGSTSFSRTVRAAGLCLTYRVDATETKQAFLRSLKVRIRQHLRKARIEKTFVRVNNQSVYIDVSDKAGGLAAMSALRQMILLVPAERGSDISVVAKELELVVSLTRPTVDDLIERTMAGTVEYVRAKLRLAGLSNFSVRRSGNTKLQVRLKQVNSLEVFQHMRVFTYHPHVHVKAYLGLLRSSFSTTNPDYDKSLSTYPTFKRSRMPIREYVPAVRSIVAVGEHIASATLDRAHPRQPAIRLQFLSHGAARLKRATSRHIGRYFAFVIGKEIVSTLPIRALNATGVIYLHPHVSLRNARKIVASIRLSFGVGRLHLVESKACLG